MNFLDQLDLIIQNKHMLEHTFYVKWSKGELTKEQLQAYAKDYYLHIKAFVSKITELFKFRIPAFFKLA
ncbi:Chlamydia protein associating with death domains [Chlamydia trachomatis]|nr:Chlamydia protein associating with death domains [Chlamydia trachomatis]